MNTGYKKIAIDYVIWLETLGYGKSLVYGCEKRIDTFFAWLESNQIHSITQLTNEHINEYRACLETRPNRLYKGRLLGTVQINKCMIAIDKLLEFLHQHGMDDAPVPANRRMKIDKHERINKLEVFTQQEIKILYNCISNTYKSYNFKERQTKQHELRLIFALYYGCGLRRTEGYNLQIQDIDFDKKTVFVRQGKNYKDRIVPMSSGVYKELLDYVYNFRHRLKLKHNRLFIYDSETQRLRLKYLQNVCDDENIKAKRITLHILRHSIATHLLQNGMSIENIALFLGHGSLDSTQIYTHLI